MVARERGYVFVVEGESDTHTLWHHGEPALGIPGAGCWKDDCDAPLLDGIDTIYVVREPDAGGDELLKRFSASVVGNRVRVITLGDTKTRPRCTARIPHCSSVAYRRRRMPRSRSRSPRRAGESRSRRGVEACQTLAQEPDILERAAAVVAGLGVAGEGIAVRLVFLAIISRLLARPVSVALKVRLRSASRLPSNKC